MPTAAKKDKVHNEWFMPIRKTTCDCGQRHTRVYAWGQYVSGRWGTVAHFCEACFPQTVLPRLVDHARPCGCSFQFHARTGYGPLPSFIKLGESSCNIFKKEASAA